jgi:hypothetical protein
MIQQTSIEAYEEVKKELGNKQNIVYQKLLFNQPASNKQLAEQLNWKINSVTPRILELRRLGKVKFWGYIYEEGRRVMAWKIV